MNTQDYPTVWAYEQACKALADAKEQLAAKDAVIERMREAIDFVRESFAQDYDLWAVTWAQQFQVLEEAITIPNDDSTLQAEKAQAKKDALLEAAEFAATQGDVDFVVWQLRRMASEGERE